MDKRRKILAINGSYREGGITDQSVDSIVASLQARGAEVETVRLRDYPIEFCLNCRECMQKPGEAPGKCVHNDGMEKLVQKIEAADGYVLAAPTNFYSVTAIFKRFTERLAVYGYWPWGKAAPVNRKANMRRKPAVIVSSCAAPGILGRLSYGTNKNLKVTARTIGARVVGSMISGLASQEPHPHLRPHSHRRAEQMASRLVA
ncbi:MAG: flavodoxin family protein [Woeseiaceae bacterium]